MLLLSVKLQKRLLLVAIAAFFCLFTGGVTLALPSIRPPQPTLRRPVWPKQNLVFNEAQRSISALSDATKPEEPATMRLLMYNIHHAEGMDGVVDLSRIIAVLREARPDVVLLTEVDTHWRRSGFEDQARAIAQQLDVPYAVVSDTLIRRNPYDAGWWGTARYGIAMLSRYPVVSVQTTPLPISDWQEPRVALTIDVQLTNGVVARVIGTHLGLSHEDRLAQIDTINSMVLDWQGPRVLMGDFNAEPHSPELDRLIGLTPPQWADPTAFLQSAAPFTFPADHPRKRIDFILVSPEMAANTTLYESPATLASDHLPVLTEIRF